MVPAENTAIHLFLPHINSLLHNAVLICRAVVPADTFRDVAPFIGDKMAANNKNGTPVEFYIIEQQVCQEERK